MQKTNYLTLLLCFVLVGAINAQTSKGNFMLGLHNFSFVAPEAGNFLAPTNALGISFGNYKSTFDGEEQKVNYTTIGLSGSAQYFLVNNFSAGITLNFYNQKISSDDLDGDFKNTLFMAGPELRYFIPVSTKTKVWIGAGAAFGTAKTTFPDVDENDPTKLSRYGGGAGIAIFPGEHFSIDLGIGYSIFKTKDDSETFGDSEDTTSGVAFDIGFSIFL